MERLTSWLPREDEIIINEEESILSSKGCITKDEERQIKNIW